MSSTNRPTGKNNMDKVSKISVYDLAYVYMYLFRPGWIGRRAFKDKKAALLEILKGRLDEGHCSESLIKYMWRCYNNGAPVKFGTLKKPGERKKNYLRSDTLYLHSYLTITPDFPVIDIDIESGGVTESASCFFREQVASINLDQICGYYLMHENLAAGLLDPSSLQQMIKYVGNKIKDIDLLLFCIDIAEDILAADSSLRISKPFDIMNYIDQARGNISYKKMLFTEKCGDKYTIIKKRDKDDPWMGIIKRIANAG